MNVSDILNELKGNSESKIKDVIRLLIKIADNIIKDPSDQKLRVLKKSNKTVAEKLLAVPGCLNCLKLIGFEERGNELVLSKSASIQKLEYIRNILQKAQLTNVTITFSQEASTSNDGAELTKNAVKTTDIVIKPITLPPLNHKFSNPFLRQIESQFHRILIYEDSDLQKRARSLVPLEILEDHALVRFRYVQQEMKKGTFKYLDLDVNDFVLMELLTWFKEEFFSWVDSPKCEFCQGETSHSHMSSDPDTWVYTNRVEMHKCKTCSKLTAFPRYNDLNILLETRRGRCGEWANCFTLFCRALNWDARFVVDQGDHVWTEVFSIALNRWVHCDPCENAFDKPLMYETGWGKKISYVMAYSAEDIQDVSWRYSTEHSEVLKRRTECTEEELLNAISELRKERQASLSECKRLYLQRRLALELVELMFPKEPSDDECIGRTSGSSAWRLARGEIGNLENTNFSKTWIFTEDQLDENMISFNYSPSLDEYVLRYSKGKVYSESDWNRGTFETKDVMRKVEKDWHQVYLCRKEGTDSGLISWKFEVEDSIKTISQVFLVFEYATFENGIVNVTICNDKVCLSLPKDKKLSTKEFAGSKFITIRATLRAGRGDVAWQHAQLFRQHEESEEFPFQLTILFQ